MRTTKEYCGLHNALQYVTVVLVVVGCNRPAVGFRQSPFETHRLPENSKPPGSPNCHSNALHILRRGWWGGAKKPSYGVPEPLVNPWGTSSRGQAVIVVQMFEHEVGMFFVGSHLIWLGRHRALIVGL